MRRSPLLLAVLAIGCAVDSPDDAHHDVPAPVVMQGPAWDAIPEAADDLQAASTPVQGGTLLALSSGRVAAANIDEDTVVFLDPASGTVTGQVAVPEHSEPGRLTEGDDGQVHVVLRRGGSVATIDSQTLELMAVTEVCLSPRGITFDDSDASLWVACESGELVHLDPNTGEADSTVLGADLRDVVIDANTGDLWVSQFKSATLLRVDHSGVVFDTIHIPDWVETGGMGEPDKPFAAMVAWQMVPHSSGGVYVLHQRGFKQTIDLRKGDKTTTTSPYGTDDDTRRGGITHTSISLVTWDDVRTSVVVDRTPLPVDMALDPEGAFVIAAAGASPNSRAPSGLVKARAAEVFDQSTFFTDPVQLTHPSESLVVAVTYDDAGRLITQGQQPFRLYVDGQEVYGTAPTADTTGFGDFHRNAGEGIACASCHPEGREDGHTWLFGGIGPRRSQQLGGGLLDTAPFHWDGEFEALDSLMHEVFERRMGGAALSDTRIEAVGEYLNGLPAPKVVSSGRWMQTNLGAELFHSDAVGCAACHSGEQTTNSENYDVGTGLATQVPTLAGVGNRLPVMHTGCAETLHERFTDPACGGGDSHGVTSHLDSEEIDALVAYLETL